MPFGKWQDFELDKVPRSYLTWLRGQPWVGAWLVREIDAVLSGEADEASEESFEEMLEKWKQDNLARLGGGTRKSKRAKSPIREQGE